MRPEVFLKISPAQHVVRESRWGLGGGGGGETGVAPCQAKLAVAKTNAVK